jgi:Uncharacterised nucleotidyltransferase
MMPVQWDRVDALIDASPGLRDLRAHGLHLLAARRWRSTGAAVPPGLVHDELQATWRTNAAPHVLNEVRAACDGPIMLVKGPAVAARFPEPTTRPFVDLDLLVPDASRVHAALLAAGWQLSGDPADYPAHLHHLPPVHSPDHPIPVEVHSRLKWMDGLAAPSFDALAAAASPTGVGVDGILEPSPAHHALVLAGHLWAHDPLARLLRILDIAVMAEASDARELESATITWGMSRLWKSTAAVADALFAAPGGHPWPLRTWARGLCSAREPSVSELHLSRLLSPFAVHPPRRALRGVSAAISGFARPHDGEPWRRKLERTANQIARPRMRRSEHVRAIEARQPPRRRH